MDTHASPTAWELARVLRLYCLIVGIIVWPMAPSCCREGYVTALLGTSPDHCSLVTPICLPIHHIPNILSMVPPQSAYFVLSPCRLCPSTPDHVNNVFGGRSSHGQASMLHCCHVPHVPEIFVGTCLTCRFCLKLDWKQLMCVADSTMS